MGERLAVGCRQAAADADVIARAVLDAVDADLAVLRFDREPVAAFDHDIVDQPRLRHRQVFREDDADARIGRIGVDLVRDDAEAVLGDDLLVQGADVGILLDGEARPVGVPGGLPDLAEAESVADQGEGFGAVVVVLRAQEPVDGAGGDVDVGRLPLRPAVRTAGEIGDGEVEPEAGIVGGDGERLAEEARRVVEVARAVGGTTGLAQRRIGIAAGIEAAPERAGERTGFVDIAAGQEIELGEALPLEARRQLRRLDDPAGGRPRRRREDAEIRLEEAPAGSGVEGEGAAFGLVEAGDLAGLEVDAFQSLEVEARIVGLGRHDHARFRRMDLPGCESRSEGRQGDEEEPANRDDDVAHLTSPLSSRPLDERHSRIRR